MLSLLLGGCAAPQIAPLPLDVVLEAPSAFELQGRIGVRYGEEGFSGNLSWRHDVHADEILLRSPLGQAVARIERNDAGVRLDVPDGHYEAPDAMELTERVLGWRLPLEGMQYWVIGRAAPNMPAQFERDDSSRVVRLRQQEWEIQYRDYRMQGRYLLPARITMRNGELELKLVADEWTLP